MKLKVNLSLACASCVPLCASCVPLCEYFRSPKRVVWFPLHSVQRISESYAYTYPFVLCAWLFETLSFAQALCAWFLKPVSLWLSLLRFARV